MVGLLTFILSIIFAAFTLARCRNRWQFVPIAFWKICLSATVAGSVITASLVCTYRPKPPPTNEVELQPTRPIAEAASSSVTMHSQVPQQAQSAATPHLVPPNRGDVIDKTSRWVMLYILGLVIGIIGVLSLVTETWDNHDIRVVTYSFSGICGVFVVIAVAHGCIESCENPDNIHSWGPVER